MNDESVDDVDSDYMYITLLEQISFLLEYNPALPRIDMKV